MPSPPPVASGGPESLSLQWPWSSRSRRAPHRGWPESWAVGAAAVLFVATGFLTPVLWDTAASFDRYAVVTILSVQYLLALLLLQISALLLVHDITGWRIAPRRDRQPLAS